MTYEEYMKSMGATEEDLKTLTNPVLRKAYDAQQASLAAAIQAKKDSDARVTQYDEWYNTVALPSTERANQERDVAVADAAAERSRLKALQDAGLVKVAGEGAAAAPAAAAAAAPGAPGFDPNKYFTREEVTHIAMREGEAIAIAQEIAAEHAVLFPDKPLKMREIRARALAAKVSVEQQWINENGVVAAREARATSDKTAYEDRLRKEGAAAKEAELRATMDPNLTIPSVSRTPFTGRTPGVGAPDPTSGRLPGLPVAGDVARENARVAKAIKNLPIVQ